MTDFKYYALADAHLATGFTVVIDVLRAFTTAACAFASGAEKIIPVSEVQEAQSLKDRFPNALTMGEVNGIQPDEFDFGNSPVAIRRVDLEGKTLIQRTTAGTQGLIKAVNADRVIAASFTVARATANYIRAIKPDRVSIIVTGESLGRDGDEDRACGEYIEALVNGFVPDPAPFIHRVRTSSAGNSFINNDDHSLIKDLEISVSIDLFSFCLPVFRKDKILVMRNEYP